jgi:sterol desaturase/sphingolipid hydroxylase (fatty acid hydroxylase superfamily)
MRSTLPPPPRHELDSTATIARSTLPPPPPRPNHKHRRTGWRMFRWFHIVAIIIAIGTSLIFGYGEAGGVVALFIILVPFEKMFRRHDQPIRRAGLRTDLTYAIVAPLLNVAGVVAGITLALLFFPLFIPALFLRPLVLGQPGWLVAVEAIVLLDILIYWTHRLSHEVGFFWRFHSIHHSSERMDWISGIRSHPFDGVIIIIPAAFLVVAGFALEVVGIAAVVQAVLGLTAHANIRWRLRPLHRIVMTPEFHHWHHSSHPEAIHTNYSVFLPLWDMVWGTYYMPADRRPQIYGQSENTPRSVPAQMLAPFSKPMREKYPVPPRVRARLHRLIPFRRRQAAVS